MTDKEIAEKKKELFKGFVEPEYYNIDDELVPNGEYGEWLRDPEDVWRWIEKLVEEEQVGAIENFIKILIENTEVIGEESIRLVYLKGITRKRLKELLKLTN